MSTQQDQDPEATYRPMPEIYQECKCIDSERKEK